MAKSLIVEIIGDATSFTEGLRSATAETEGFGSKLGGLLAPIAAVGAGLLAAFGVEKVAELFHSAVEGASSVQKSMEVINSTFGQSASIVSDFGDKTAAGFGVSAQAADAVSAKFGILFQNMGVGHDEAAQMTVGWEELAGSLSQIKGVDPTPIMNAMTLAAEGNTRGLKQLGIDLTTTAKNQEAANLGFGDAYSKLTAAQQSVVIYSLATAELPKYLQDAKNHSSDLADQTRILSAEWSNAKDKLGAELLPVMTRVTTFMASEFPVAIQDVSRGFDQMKQTAQQVWDWMAPTVESVFSRVKGYAQELVTGLENHWGQIKADVHNVVSIVESVFSGLKAFWDRFHTEIEAVARAAWSTIKGIFQGGVKVIEGLFQTIAAVLSGHWGKALDGLKKVAEGAWQQVDAIFGGQVAAMGAFATAIGTAVWSALQHAWDAIVVGAQLAWAGIQSVFAGAAGWFEGIGSALMNGLATGIENAAQGVYDKLKSVAGKVLGVAKSVFSIASPSQEFAAIGDALMEGLAVGVDRSSKQAVQSLHQAMSQAKQAMDEDKAAIVQAANLIGVAATQAIVNGSLGVQQSAGEQLKQSLLQAMAPKLAETAESPLIQQASQMIGAKATQAVVDGVIGTQQSLKQQLHDALVQAMQPGLAETADAALIQQSAQLIGQKATQSIVDGVMGKQETLKQKLKDALVQGMQPALQLAAAEPAIEAAAKLIGEKQAQSVVDGVVGKQTTVTQQIKDALTTAVQPALALAAVAPEVQAAAKQLGEKQVQAIIDSVLGKKQSLTDQIKTALEQASTQATQQAEQAVQTATSAFGSSFQQMGQQILSAFDAQQAGYVPPAKKLLDTMQLQDQTNQYRDAVKAAMTAIVADQKAITAAGAAAQLAAQSDTGTALLNGQQVTQAQALAAQTAANAQLLSDQAGYHAAARSLQEFNLGQTVQKETDTHNTVIANEREKLAERLTQLQNELTKHPGEYKKVGDQIVSTLDEFDVPMYKSGEKFASQFASGLSDGIASVEKAARALADALAKYVPKSPARVGPLSFSSHDAGHKFGAEFSQGVTKGLSFGEGFGRFSQPRAAAFATSARGPAFASAAGGITNQYIVNAPNYVGDHRDLSEALKHPSVSAGLAVGVRQAFSLSRLRPGDLATGGGLGFQS